MFLLPLRDTSSVWDLMQITPYAIFEIEKYSNIFLYISSEAKEIKAKIIGITSK